MSSPDPSSETATTPRAPAENMVVNYFIVSNDIERSRRFYADILGGEVVFSGVPTVVASPTARSSSIWVEARQTTSRPSPWRRRATTTASAASSISG